MDIKGNSLVNQLFVNQAKNINEAANTYAATSEPSNRKIVAASPFSDRVSISSEAYEKQQKEPTNWVTTKYNERAKSYSQSVDSRLVLGQDPLASDIDIMERAEFKAYAEISVLAYPKEVNGKLNFYYPDNSTTLPFEVNSGKLNPESYTAKYRDKWEGLREERIKTFEELKNQGTTPFEILIKMQQMDPLYIDGKNLEGNTPSKLLAYS